MIKCKKCGFENRNDAKFCMNCGAKIERKRFCDECGHELQEGAKFCDECGHPVGGETKKVASAKQKQNEVLAPKANGTKLQRIMTIVVEGVALLFFAMMFIAIWGDFIKISSSAGAVQTRGVAYWFKDGWKLFETDSLIYAADKATFIFGFLVFLGSLICIYIFGIMGTIKSIKSIAKGSYEVASTKQSTRVVIFASLYFIFERMLFSYSSVVESSGVTSSASTSFGWGGIIYLVCVSLFLLAVLANRIAQNVTTIKNTPLIVKDCSSFVLILLFAVVGFGVMFGYQLKLTTIQQTITQTNSVSPFNLLDLFRSYFGKSGGDFPLAAFMIAILSIISIIVAFVFVLLSFNSMLSLDKKKSGKFGVFLPVATGSYLLSFIFGLTSIALYLKFMESPTISYTYQATPAPAAIVAIVFAAAGIVLFYIFRNKSNKKEKALNASK